MYVYVSTGYWCWINILSTHFCLSNINLDDTTLRYPLSKETLSLIAPTYSIFNLLSFHRFFFFSLSYFLLSLFLICYISWGLYLLNIIALRYRVIFLKWKAWFNVWTMYVLSLFTYFLHYFLYFIKQSSFFLQHLMSPLKALMVVY